MRRKFGWDAWVRTAFGRRTDGEQVDARRTPAVRLVGRGHPAFVRGLPNVHTQHGLGDSGPGARGVRVRTPVYGRRRRE